MLGLPSNVFKGVIVTFKRSEAFGFIRSCQVSGDVYVHTDHMDREVKKGSDLVGKTVLFTVKDADRKSLGARNVVLTDESVPLSVVGGRIVAWDGGVGEGCMELDQMGLRMAFIREELDVTRRKQTKTLVGRKVRFHLPSRQEPCGGGQEYKVGDKAPLLLICRTCSVPPSLLSQAGHAGHPSHLGHGWSHQPV